MLKRFAPLEWRANCNKSRSKGLVLCQVAGDHIQVAGWCGDPGDTWGGPRHVKTAVGTFEELGKLLSPMHKEVFQYFNNHMISLGFVFRWFSVFIIVLSSGLHLMKTLFLI